MSDNTESGSTEAVLKYVNDLQAKKEREVLPFWREQVAANPNDLSLKWSEYIPVTPTAKQLSALLLDNYKEVFYGGAAGGGKSIWLLMSALQWVDQPKYSAIIFRRSLASAQRSGGVLDVAHEWLLGTDAKWDNASSTYWFPSGASLAFGYLNTDQDFINFQGPEYNFVGFDELTQFPEQWYTYLFSRCRRLKGSPIPSRIRAAGNPGGLGHSWVKERFKIDWDGTSNVYRGFHDKRPMVPAFAWDNTHLDVADYIESLTDVDPITREQLMKGDWSIAEQGRFRSSWFKKRYSTRGGYISLSPDFTAKPYPKHQLRFFMCVDPAASSREGPGDAQVFRNKEPSWSVISTWFVIDNHVLGLWDIIRFQKEIPEVCREIHDAYKAALANGLRIEFVGVEFNGLNKGVYQYVERMGLPVKPLDPSSGDKLTRSSDFANRAFAGHVYLPSANDPQAGSWLPKYETELFTWTNHPGQASDQIDVSSYAGIIMSTEYSHFELANMPGNAPLIVPSSFNQRF